MHCPFCQHEDTRVIDSRLTEDGSTVRRRRECPACGERFNTFETAELKLPAIVKSGERREAFDERKLRVSFERALQKRPVASDAVDAAVREIVNDLRRSGEREVPSRQVGELVMRELKKLDQVAYVRFASVYRKFEDVQAFLEEIAKLEHDLPELEKLQLSLLAGGEAAAAEPRRPRKG
ncbi:transcriptional regulator NrdR [Rhodanobacter sp. C06]|uniref:transcriptional regulator NrdR n=1 Tax=Rhodanobacter sp. C06 TaxID=1945854 RepID=UPI0009874BFF|nr:transcriptional regulator NrdR [Rhodanobacter sp. C06]OOG36102.1 transcriptional regulator NrdR [Rhodanobacter sp. C06]OOG36185.1 transcriptional regulator NrdR [Rhodanobacter sp. C06]